LSRRSKKNWNRKAWESSRQAIERFQRYGLSPEQAKTIQAAFKKALTDPQFQPQAKKRRLDIYPVSGEELAALAREVIAQPSEVIARMKRLLDK
jgi:tripartite-type tricarboxylate transporter receptor subunit TctC